MQKTITNPPGGANIGEWCKNIKCWNSIKDYDYIINAALEKELISVARPFSCEQQLAQVHNAGINSATENEQKLIEDVKAIPPSTWFALSRWAKETNNFQPWQRSIIFNVGALLGRTKDPSPKQANQAIKAYLEAINKGFTV